MDILFFLLTSGKILVYEPLFDYLSRLSENLLKTGTFAFISSYRNEEVPLIVTTTV